MKIPKDRPRPTFTVEESEPVENEVEVEPDPIRVELESVSQESQQHSIFKVVVWQEGFDSEWNYAAYARDPRDQDSSGWHFYHKSAHTKRLTIGKTDSREEALEIAIEAVRAEKYIQDSYTKLYFK